MCNATEFVIENGILIRYDGPGGDVVIPDGVTTISDHAFAGKKETLKSVRIPDSVTTIGSMSFYDCPKLKEVVVPDSVTSVGALAFHNCKKLADGNGLVVVCNTVWGYFGQNSEVVIPDGVVKIADKAFFECRGLTTAVLPESVVSIGRQAFYDCRNLRSINLPSSVTDIGDNAFWRCENLADADGFVMIRNVLYSYHGRNTDVAVPENVTHIGDRAFFGCSHLTSVVLPEHASVGKEVFSGCTNLQSIVAPAVPFDYFKEAKRPIPAMIGFFKNREAYKDPVIAAEYVKYAVSQKKKVLPILFETDMVQGVTEIVSTGKIALKNVDTELLQPAMEANATQCVAFLMDWKNKQTAGRTTGKPLDKELTKDAVSPADLKKLWSYGKLPDGTLEITGYKGEETEITIPERIGKVPVTAIAAEAFSPDKEKRPKKQAAVLREICSITIPECVTCIGTKAFYGCEKLADSNGFVVVRDVLYNYYGTAEAVSIPDGISVIGSGALARCETIKNIIIPERVTIIEDAAFFACSNLSSVNIPQGVTKIGADAFSLCSSLANVQIPESVTNLGDSVFALCHNLTELQIPGSVTAIGDMAFIGCGRQFTIHAPAGSYAEQYAKENTIPFTVK